MIIISHRGYWIRPDEKNTIQAFKKSFDHRFGTETDLRDRDEDLVISHDMASSESITLTAFFEQYNNKDLLLALNIKADGLQKKLKEHLDRLRIKNYFVFDMSIPDTISYVNSGMNFFCRQSEYETDLPFYNESKGVWLDAFTGTWYEEGLIASHLANNKKVCIVSAELHGRAHIEHWEAIKKMSCITKDELILCTDFPEAAAAYFKT